MVTIYLSWGFRGIFLWIWVRPKIFLSSRRIYITWVFTYYKIDFAMLHRKCFPRILSTGKYANFRFKIYKPWIRSTYFIFRNASDDASTKGEQLGWIGPQGPLLCGLPLVLDPHKTALVCILPKNIIGWRMYHGFHCVERAHSRVSLRML